jgi:hypothetical protein
VEFKKRFPMFREHAVEERVQGEERGEKEALQKKQKK